MSKPNTALHLPDYHTFLETIAILGLPISGSELHGVMCGYLCAGAVNEGEAYLRALMTKRNDTGIRNAALALFELYAASQQQLLGVNFEFQLLLPDEEDPLTERAQAFSEWCEGFIQGITVAGVSFDDLEEEDAQEALEHLTEFAQLDYQTLQVDEEDEHALMEVSEYARMAVLHIFLDLQSGNLKKGSAETAH